MYPNNEVRRRGVRANLTGQLSPKLDVGVRAGYNQSRLKLPQNDNNDLSPIANGVCSAAREDDPDLRGNLFYPVEVMNAIYTRAGRRSHDARRATATGVRCRG